MQQLPFFPLNSFPPSFYAHYNSSFFTFFAPPKGIGRERRRNYSLLPFYSENSFLSIWHVQGCISFIFELFSTFYYGKPANKLALAYLYQIIEFLLLQTIYSFCIYLSIKIVTINLIRQLYD